MSDKLFILRPGFFDGDRGPLFCSDSLVVEGFLGFYPEIRERVAVSYIAAARPRHPIVELLGQENQSAPVLVLDGDSDVRDSDSVRRVGSTRFINDPDAIVVYLATAYSVGTAA